jgi:hypothetical protein
MNTTRIAFFALTVSIFVLIVAFISMPVVAQLAKPMSSATQFTSRAALPEFPRAKYVLPHEINPPGALPRINPLGRNNAAVVDDTYGPGASLFSRRGAYTSGGAAPTAITTADVNDDGRLDLIVLNQCSHGNNGNCMGRGVVSVMLGNGDGTFQAPQTYDSGGYIAVQVIAGDINGDGKTDLVLLNTCLNSCDGSTDGSIGILVGNGDGTFQAARTLDTDRFDPSSMAVGDINGDGKLDLAVSYFCDFIETQDCSHGAVDVFVGNGDGTFQTPQRNSSAGYVTQDVILGDINGDGKPDLLLANCGSPNCYFGTVGVLVGNGDGTFQPAQTYSSGGVFAMAVTAGDLNGDGQLDLIVENDCLSPGFCSGAVVSVLLGNGDGTLQTAQTYNTGSYGCSNAGYCPVSIALADVDGDGKLDIVVPFDVLLGNGDGTFQSPLAYDSTGCGRGQMVVADLNNDGRPDISLVNYYAKNSCGAIGVTTLLNVSPWRTITSVNSSVGSSSYGQSITFTANVSTQGKGIPNGSVTFSDGGSVLGRSPLRGGVATFSVHSLTLGSHSILALYFGTTNFAASSSSMPQAVNRAPTNTALTTWSDHSSYGQTITLRAEVAPSYGGTLTGAVMFFDGATPLASMLLSNGRATLALSTLATGVHSLTAAYAGDTFFTPSSSLAFSHTVQVSRVALSLTSDLNPAAINQPVTFSLVVKGTVAFPTGSATLKMGSTVLGSTSLTNGQASFTTAFPAAGNHFVVAEYSGDQNYLPGISSSFKQVVHK